MTPKEFNAFWTRTFPECPPVGFLLKHIYRTRCVRFEGSHDRPESEDSCYRHNALLDHLFRSEARIALITTIPSENEVPPGDAPAYLNVDPEGHFFQSLGMHEFELEFETPSYWHLFVGTRAWTPGDFDPLLRTVSDGADGAVNVVFVGPATRRLMYVHDHGVDIVMESDQKRDQLRDRYSDWTLDTNA